MLPLQILRLYSGSRNSSWGFTKKMFAHSIHSVKPQNQDIEALIDWVVSSLDLGRGIASVLNEPATAGSAQAAVGALMIILRLNEARLLFVKANGIKL